MRQNRHMTNFSGRPGVVCDFNNQNLISYQGNFHAKGDVSFVIYFDFETTAPTDNCLDPEQKKMFVVLYVMIVAFNPELNLERIIVQRSFAHSIDELTSLNYFTREQIIFIDQGLIKMLKDMAFEIAKRRCKSSIGEMFSIKSALIKKTLLKWFNRKFKHQFNKINPIKKQRYESKNPINWKEDKYVICKFLIKLEPTNYETPDDEMSVGDFVIHCQYNFLRNIYTEEQIKDSHHVKDLKSYYEKFEEYTLIFVGLFTLLNNFNRTDFINSATENFVDDKFAGDKISEIKNTINKTEIKNALSEMHGNVPKLT